MHPPALLLLLTVTSPVTGLPPMQRGNCRRSEVRTSMDGLSPCSVTLRLCTALP